MNAKINQYASVAENITPHGNNGSRELIRELSEKTGKNYITGAGTNGAFSVLRKGAVSKDALKQERIVAGGIIERLFGRAALAS